MSSERTFILWDGRACGGQGTSESQMLCMCDDEHDARRQANALGHEAACYSYASGPPSKTGRSSLIDERWEWDHYARDTRPRRRRRRR